MRRSCVFLRLRRNILVMAVLSGLCATVTHAQVKAVLYPYIPDAAHDGFTALKEELQVKFKESTGGDFTADITIDPKLNLYDLDTLKYLFECQKADVVEIDTLLLGALENTGLVAPVENMDFMKEISILKEAQQAATLGGQLYAVPTYLCSNVVYSYKNLDLVTGGKGLLSELGGQGKIPLVGNYKGSFTLANTYLDALADTVCPQKTKDECTQELGEALKNQSITEGVLEYFSPLVDSCSSEKELNPCLRGDYRGNHCAATALVARQAKGYVGFTEELFYILTASKNVTSEKPNINVISAPLGKGSYPVMFVDALVVSKKCKEDKECFERVQKFIRFMSETKTRELIAFSQDAGKGAVPRYTLQANTDFYEGKLAQEDHYYPKFRGIIDSAAIFPNDVSAAGYKTLSEKVSKSLSSPPK